MNFELHVYTYFVWQNTKNEQEILNNPFAMYPVHPPNGELNNCLEQDLNEITIQGFFFLIYHCVLATTRTCSNELIYLLKNQYKD